MGFFKVNTFLIFPHVISSKKNKKKLRPHLKRVKDLTLIYYIDIKRHNSYVCMYVRMYVCMYVCMCNMCVSVCVCVCLCVSACLCISSGP